MTSKEQKWDAQHYDGKMGFVAKLGAGVLELLDARPEERVLDLGCGTGALTNELASRGAQVEGIDLSEEMIEAAKANYPHIPFAVEDAHSYRADAPFDAVFSNAALHWMRQPERVIEAVAANLRPGGRFAAEFGGADNVSAIVSAIGGVLEERFGIDADSRNPWYYPTIGEYASLLERQGFRVLSAEHFDRPTPLPEGDRGLRNWLDTFAGIFFAGLTESEREEAYREIEERARPKLYRDGCWYGDYRRLRILAVLKTPRARSHSARSEV
ncbi:methyltransferase type 11 [Paenibacillus sp. J31TS4]|uniref:class I SAM-dependent methyltransferase n=1 Tax=Paenibacillus sp. J31TS4 TaxID=2807195 RepID=UPI001B28F3B4|nr:class I SAM-dependent methyltransferase [Paenibacillus sp. J31TS4]GIP39280.1 methyltransferase type 11 [Paenibacillus sp. J31TS4]